MFSTILDKFLLVIVYNVSIRSCCDVCMVITTWCKLLLVWDYWMVVLNVRLLRLRTSWKLRRFIRLAAVAPTRAWNFGRHHRLLLFHVYFFSNLPC